MPVGGFSMIGKIISHFKIEEKLGSGGMRGLQGLRVSKSITILGLGHTRASGIKKAATRF
jgi:hypothetical protein